MSSKFIENTAASGGFEKGFMTTPIETLIAGCNGYELAALFESTFKNHQPVLEAGCGSGKWCGWFSKKGIASDGIDWSRSLMERAQRNMPQSNFIVGDIRNIPKSDSYYGGIIALGSVEHSPEGPVSALNEFSRVLKHDGIAIVTVPNGGHLRRTTWTLKKILRAIFRSHSAQAERIGRTEAEKQTTKSWFPQFVNIEGNKGGDEKAGWNFFEYEFSQPDMRNFVRQTNLEIVKVFVAFKNEGILHNFGKLAGTWNEDRLDVDFTILGHVLSFILPVSIVGHMQCYVLKNKKSEKTA